MLQLVSKDPYRMRTLQMVELKMELQELLEKGSIQTSVFLWGASILFVKMKYETLRSCIDYKKTKQSYN